LTDKLVKRISEFNEETIKGVEKQVVETVRVMTMREEFQEERVFKASGAAGQSVAMGQGGHCHL
jgi:hypothetical protein